MANLGATFDATQVAPQVAFEPVPEGWYNCRIAESELKPTKANDGTMLALTLEVLDGQYAGRKLFDRLNIVNPNPQAVEIAQRRLSAYCHATGIFQVQDSQQLHGIPFKAKVTVSTDPTGKYEPSNEEKQVKNINEATGNVGTPTAQLPQQATQAPQGFPPPMMTPPQFPQQPAPSQFPAQPQAPQFPPQQPQFPPQAAPSWNPMGQQLPPQQAAPAPQSPQAPQQPATQAPTGWGQQAPQQAPQQPQFPPQPQQGSPAVPPWARK